nr:sigma-70 family RNA polymerase sigma factor [Phytoactinopolyspora mesophila]
MTGEGRHGRVNHVTHGVGVEVECAALDRIRAGDDDAVDTVYREIAPLARQTANRILRDHHAADDMVQEAFYLVIRAIRAGRGPTDSFEGYLLSTVRRLAYQHWTAERRTICTDDIWSEHLVDAPTVPTPQSDLVGAAWASLPQRWRSILWLIEVDRYAPAEIARELSMNANAVSSLASRARCALRAAYLTLACDLSD